MKIGDPKPLKVEGKTLPTTYLGQGMFSTAYRLGDDVYLVSRNDPGKEILLHAGPHPHLPKIEQIELREDDALIYRMPYYTTLSAKSTDAWRLSKELDTLWQSAKDRFCRERNGCLRWDWDAYIAVQYFCDDLADSQLSPQIKDAFDVLAAWMANYGYDLLFDFKKTNFGVSPEGRLILRDVIFSGLSASEVYARRHERSRSRYAVIR